MQARLATLPFAGFCGPSHDAELDYAMATTVS